MAKLSMKQFSDWLGYDPETVSSAIEIVRISDSDGAYTHAQDMGEDEMAEVIEAIYFEHGSLKDAIQACKEDLGLIQESINIEMIDQAISNEKDSKQKNKLVGIRANVLHKKPLTKSQTELAKKYNILESKENTNKMKSQKIKLTELKQLVKKTLTEEKNKKNMITKSKKFFDYILQGSDATEENAIGAARGLDWQEIETEINNYPHLDYIDTVNGVGIYYNYGHDAYYFTDESDEMNESKILNELGPDKKSDKVKFKQYIKSAITRKYNQTDDPKIKDFIKNRLSKTVEGIYDRYKEDFGTYSYNQIVSDFNEYLNGIIKAVEGSENKITESTKPKTQKIKLTELRQLVKQIIKEEQSNKKVIKESWEGVDRDLETSLFEYGFVAKQRPDKDYPDEWFVLYDAGNSKFDTGHIRETELNNIVLGKEWAKPEDIEEFLSFVGSDLEDWLQSSFTNKLSDVLSYWGPDNIMGSSYGGFSKEEAEQMLMTESVKPKTQKIKLSELRQLVKGMLKEGNEKTPLEYIKYGKEDFLEEDMYSISYYAYDSLKKKNCILTISKTPGSSWDYNIEYK